MKNLYPRHNYWQVGWMRGLLVRNRKKVHARRLNDAIFKSIWYPLSSLSGNKIKS